MRTILFGLIDIVKEFKLNILVHAYKIKILFLFLRMQL